MVDLPPPAHTARVVVVEYVRSVDLSEYLAAVRGVRKVRAVVVLHLPVHHWRRALQLEEVIFAISRPPIAIQTDPLPRDSTRKSSPPATRTPTARGD